MSLIELVARLLYEGRRDMGQSGRLPEWDAITLGDKWAVEARTKALAAAEETIFQVQVQRKGCPIHGEVEGYTETSGALSNCWPYPVLCEKCPTGMTIIRYENEDDEEVDSEGEPL